MPKRGVGVAVTSVLVGAVAAGAGQPALTLDAVSWAGVRAAALAESANAGVVSVTADVITEAAALVEAAGSFADLWSLGFKC